MTGIAEPEQVPAPVVTYGTLLALGLVGIYGVISCAVTEPGIVLTVATLAALIPAARAAFMRPMRTLREDWSFILG